MTSWLESNYPWRKNRSMLEMKVVGLPKRDEQKKTFDNDFGTPNEPPPYTSISDELGRGFATDLVTAGGSWATKANV
jgi:hypothetical protein